MTTTKSPPAVANDEREALAADGFDRIAEAQAFLGLSRASIYALMDKGELPYARFGRSRRIPRRALVEFAARSIVPQAAGGGAA
jgi:excisionase family DNA binding protein